MEYQPPELPSNRLYMPHELGLDIDKPEDYKLWSNCHGDVELLVLYKQLNTFNAMTDEGKMDYEQFTEARIQVERAIHERLIEMDVTRLENVAPPVDFKRP